MLKIYTDVPLANKTAGDYYKDNNGTICVIKKSMCEHHPHGLDDPTPIISFIEKNL
ncbi:MAG: hypothetical protein II997_05825 [Clostridia bacterium]|nr:hypothetical protein [Clostridia bacterium]